MASLCNDWTLPFVHRPTQKSPESVFSPHFEFCYLQNLLLPSKPAEIKENFTKNSCLLTKQIPSACSGNSSSWMEVSSAISLVCPDSASYNLRSCQTTLIIWVTKECCIKIQPSNLHLTANYGIGRENINPKEKQSYQPTAGWAEVFLPEVQHMERCNANFIAYFVYFAVLRVIKKDNGTEGRFLWEC